MQITSNCQDRDVICCNCREYRDSFVFRFSVERLLFFVVICKSYGRTVLSSRERHAARPPPQVRFWRKRTNPGFNSISICLMITTTVPAYRGPILALIAFPLRYTREAAAVVGSSPVVVAWYRFWVSVEPSLDSGDLVPLLLAQTRPLCGSYSANKIITAYISRLCRARIILGGITPTLILCRPRGMHACREGPVYKYLLYRECILPTLYRCTYTWANMCGSTQTGSYVAADDVCGQRRGSDRDYARCIRMSSIRDEWEKIRIPR